MGKGSCAQKTEEQSNSTPFIFHARVLFARIRSEIPKGAWDERIHTKNKGKYTAVTTSVEQGWLVKACNRASDFRWSDVNYDYYIKEIEKLQIGNHGVS